MGFSHVCTYLFIHVVWYAYGYVYVYEDDGYMGGYINMYGYDCAYECVCKMVHL